MTIFENMNPIRNQRKPSKNDLPELSKSTLNLIFDNVYGDLLLTNSELVVFDGHSSDEKIIGLLTTLRQMQIFNYQHRQNDIRQSIERLDPIFNFFWGGSEGPIFWLALIHAVRELYGLSESALVIAMRQVDVRK
ncbi:MAG: hypothetical protein AABY68_09390 [Pseudomonadota bacterium]